MRFASISFDGRYVVSASLVLFALTSLRAAEVEELTAENWKRLAPRGKEVDAIYGDYVLRNDKIQAVIARPVEGRHANLTVLNVGGSLIDLTSIERPNDQLSAFYPASGQVTFDPAVVKNMQAGSAAGRGGVTLTLTGKRSETAPHVVVDYILKDEQPYLDIRTTYTNREQEPIALELTDALRADRDFEFHSAEGGRYFYAYEPWWEQAYAIVADGHTVTAEKTSLARKRPFLNYAKQGKSRIKLEPGERYTLTRRLIPGANVLDVKAIATRLIHPGVNLRPVELTVQDEAGPVGHARVEIRHAGGGKEAVYGAGRTDSKGRLHFLLPEGRFEARVNAVGRPQVEDEIAANGKVSAGIEMQPPGYVVARITDEQGGAIPCKVEFRPRGGTAGPDFGPDTAEHGVGNLHYSHTGSFRREIGPGEYDVIISHGPEHDAVFTQIEVARGEETPLPAKLIRTVDTSGWVSADYHSHSSPSGDNTSSQLGRVLNLLCEHIEFAPCTEHNRVSSYEPHLKHLGASHRMATCSGIELTGRLLPVNHQNAFPLVHKPHTQDGGAPRIDVNPLVQIERLALWDEGSDKLVQENHPNIMQVVGDKDLDGVPDGGFERMFGYMDVIEVHPPGAIFAPREPPDSPRARPNRMLNWLQLLNLGYRLPGVVNTDAHYNFHGSGWLRNYIESPTDNPAKIKTMDIVHASEHGHIVMTNGPFLEVHLSSESPKKASAIAGDSLLAEGGKAELRVRVQCPNWLDVNRVQVLINGRAEKELNFTRKSHADHFGDGVVKFDRQIPLSLKGDAHVIVAVAGEGLKLGLVAGPAHGGDMPVAVANPIFVDVDGDGFKPNRDLFGLPFPVEKDHEPSKPHGHPHHDHDHREHDHKDDDGKGGAAKSAKRPM